MNNPGYTLRVIAFGLLCFAVLNGILLALTPDDTGIYMVALVGGNIGWCLCGAIIFLVQSWGRK